MAVYTNEEWLESEDFPFYIAKYVFEPHEVKESHSHEFIECVFVAEGTGMHIYGGREKPISRGDVFIIEPDAEHAYIADEQLTVYNVLLLNALVNEELVALAKFTPFVDFFYLEPFLRQQTGFSSHLSLSRQELLEIFMFLDGIHEEFTRKKMGYQVIVKTRLIELLVLLSRFYDDKMNKTNNHATNLPGNAEMIHQIGKYIERNYTQPLTLQQVSRLCGMSQTVFSTLFKQINGYTFIEFRNRTRIKAACDFLVGSDEKILAVMEKVGFEDVSFFNRTFKSQTGYTPGMYRKVHRE